MIVGGWLFARFPNRKGGTPANSPGDFAEDELWALFVAVVPASMAITVLFWALGSHVAARVGLVALMSALGWMLGEAIPLQLLIWRRLGLDAISRTFWLILVPATCAVTVGALSAWL